MRAPLCLAPLLGLLAATLSSGASAAPSEVACEERNNNSFLKLLECLSIDDVDDHLVALQEVADANGGTRVSTSAGFDASVDYVTGVLEDAGYTVTVDPFDFLWDGWTTHEPYFAQVDPDPVVYEQSYDYVVARYSGSGEVEATVEGVDLNIGGASTSGCTADDFATFTAGNVALIRRGTCYYYVKVGNAEAAGASAVIIMNSSPGLGVTKAILYWDAAIPVIFVSYELGLELQDTEVSIDIDWLTEERESYNLFAQTERGSTSNVVMAGAHLDSMQIGPGIEDNGTGVAALLEIAESMSNLHPVNAVRFAFWSAEEHQLQGSYDWVARAYASGELENVALYLNYDMIGSPNWVPYVYMDDGVPGTAAVTDMFLRYFDVIGLPVEQVFAYGRADHSGFEVYDEPTGGLFTGAEELKTEEQAALYGGTAGEALDPCYHRACDDYGNVDFDVLDVMLNAAGVSILQYAMNTEDVNGVPGRDEFSMDRFEENVERAFAH